MSFNDWECVVGLEIHAQMKTKSKLFSSDSTSFGSAANEHVAPVSIGLPGSLPVLNKEVIHLAMKTGLALNCEISEQSVFSRKNYFYPDLSKGYQISQFDKPICKNGFVEFFVGDEIKKINLERAHLEEDAGKSNHHGEYTLIDYNRAGIPLLEIVSKPEIKSAKEAAEFMRAIRNTMRYVGACDGNLEEGSLRCDCNVSIRKKGDKELGTRVEIKNINSFRFVEKAIEYEVHRQIDSVEGGKEIEMETRLYDHVKNKTFTMRKKEEAHDYRYFPDPDLLPLKISKEQIEKTRKELTELPFNKIQRYQKEYKLSLYDSQSLTQERDIASYFEEVVVKSKNPKQSANWILGDFFKLLNEENAEINSSKVKPKQLAELILMVEDNSISGKIAKQIFEDMYKSGSDPKSIVEEKGLKQITDNSAIEKIVEEVLNESPSQVNEYKAGKTKLMGYFVGQIMKKTQGQANPDQVNKTLKEKLK